MQMNNYDYSKLKDKIKKQITGISFEERFNNFLVAMFSTSETDSNLFFSEWERAVFETILLLDGKIAICFDSVAEQYCFGYVNFVGNLDCNGQGIDVNVNTLNGHMMAFRDWRNNNEVVVIFNNSTHSPDLNVCRYTELATETWTSIMCDLKGSRYSKIISAQSEKTIKALNQAINSNSDGKPITIVSANVFDENGGLNDISLSDIKNSDKIQYLSAFMTWIERNFVNQYGMASQGMDKIAQQNQSEIENGALSAWVEVIDRLNERQVGFKKVKKFFNIDIPYDLSEVWKQEYKRILSIVNKEEGDGDRCN